MNTLLAAIVLASALIPWLTSLSLAQSVAPSSAGLQENEFPSTAPKSNTSLVQQIGEQGLTVPKTPIYNEDALFYNKATPSQLVPLNSAGGFQGDWNQDFTWQNEPWTIGGIGEVAVNQVCGLLIGCLQWLSSQIAPYLAKVVIWILNQAVYNPNIAANQPQEIARYVQQLANVMRAIAFDLLLLLFILAIWKYWTQAAWKGGGNLMGAVGRLIMTGLLLVGWNTLSDYVIQISNDLTSQILFGPGDAALINQAMTNLVTLSLGSVATGLFGQILGGISFFSLLLVMLAQAIFLLVLKATQIALLIAQYVFAPIFLVFFASPSTEGTATGFLKSFVEVSLWTFVWVGMLRILVIILGSSWNPFGQMIMVIGVLQLMISVPQFIARAQISPTSEIIEGGAILFQAHKMAKSSGFIGEGGTGGLLKKNWDSLTGKLTNKSTDNQFGGGAMSQLAALGRGAGGGGFSGPSFTSPSGPAPFGPSSPSGGPTATSGGAALNPAFPGPVNRKQTGAAADSQKQLGALQTAAAGYASANAKAGQRGGIAETSVPGGTGVSPVFGEDGRINELKIGDRVPAYEANKARLAAQTANQLMSQTSATDTLKAAAKVSGPSGPTPAAKTDYNQKLGAAAYNGAASWINGTSAGNAVGSLLAKQNGGHLQVGGKDDNRNSVLEAMGDDALPHSPNHSNYAQNSRDVAAAGLKPTAGPMAAVAAMHSSGAKFTTGTLGGAYRALGAAAAVADAASPTPLLAGKVPGTAEHEKALGKSIQRLSPDQVKAAAAVGSGLTGVPGAGGYSDEDVAAMVETTDSIVSGGGARDHTAAFGALSSIARATGGFSGSSSKGSLGANLKHAALVTNSLGQHHSQALQNPNFAQQVFQLDGGSAHNEVNPVSMASAANIAQKVGPSTFVAPRDLDDEHWMIESGGYSEGNAAGDLRYNQAARPFNGGTLLTRGAVQNLQGMATGPANANSVAVATVLASGGYSGARASAGAQQIVRVAEHEMTAGNNMIGGHAATDPADYIRHMPASIIGGYMDLANHPDGIQYDLQVVQSAAALASQGYASNVASAASVIHRYMDAHPSNSSGQSVTASEVAGLQANMAAHNFAPSARNNVGVINTMMELSSSGSLNSMDPGHMAAANHLTRLNPTGNFSDDNLTTVWEMANTLGFGMNQITPTTMNAVSVIEGHNLGIQPTRQVVTNMLNAGIPINNAESVYVASQPVMQRIPAHELGGVCENVIQYAEAQAIVANAVPGATPVLRDVGNISSSELRSIAADYRLNGPTGTVSPAGAQSYINQIANLKADTKTSVDGVSIKG